MTSPVPPDLAASHCLALGRRALHQLRATLERESGRGRVSLSDLVRGEPLADVTHELQPRAKVIGKSDPAEVHRAALSRALSSAGVSSSQEPKRLVA